MKGTRRPDRGIATEGHGSHLVRQVHIARSHRQGGFAKGAIGPLRATVRRMHELFGDSTRDGEWAAVRLQVDGDRVVDADAPGLARPLVGLTLLEAAAVGGETLAVDALANAIGPAFNAAPSQTRVAVAMSGGVDSAVVLLRSAPDAIGVTLRLWLDPAG